jgi:Tfp pilus assembly protein PilV
MHKKALSLLEILIATMILSLVVIGLVNVFISGKRYVLHSRSRMTGAELGRYFIDPYQMQVNQGNWTNNCLSNSTLCLNENMGLDGVTYNVSYSSSNVPGTTLRKLIANISWNEITP